mmetsp:Transcript_23966/g.60309  ORF Transcript_23966/g.60309 Transcript_23966/m.60309 type:complete len:218 (-) Transcript_23966:156-809(-)|eukprot:jgi/Tetstr1/421023/TSEL_012068.t1
MAPATAPTALSGVALRAPHRAAAPAPSRARPIWRGIPGVAGRGALASAGRRAGWMVPAKATENEAEATPPQAEKQGKEHEGSGIEGGAGQGSFSEEEIAAMAAERRAAKAAAAGAGGSSNVVTGALEEAQLIIWPAVGDALVNTVVVIGIVFVTAAMLFGVNSGLAVLSNTVYGSGKVPSSTEKPSTPAAAASPAPAVKDDAQPPPPPPKVNVPSSL